MKRGLLKVQNSNWKALTCYSQKLKDLPSLFQHDPFSALTMARWPAPDQHFSNFSTSNLDPRLKVSSVLSLSTSDFRITPQPTHPTTMKVSNFALLAAASATTASAFLAPSVAKSAGRPAATSGVPRNLFNKLFSSSANTGKYPIVAEESAMSKKAHGTSEKPVMKDLRWSCDFDTADRICVSASSIFGFNLS
jgi:hypothetical protein